jgi:hypothetical protein
MPKEAAPTSATAATRRDSLRLAVVVPTLIFFAPRYGLDAFFVDDLNADQDFSQSNRAKMATLQKANAGFSARAEHNTPVILEKF